MRHASVYRMTESWWVDASEDMGGWDDIRLEPFLTWEQALTWAIDWVEGKI